MSWKDIFDPYSFERARRKEAYSRFGRAVKRQPPSELLPLDEVEERLELFERTYVGIEPVAVAKIVGSADRTGDFDRDFRPLHPEVRERWQEIERAFPRGDFPPIILYQVGDAYFVVDGHHRVAVAKHKEVEFIDAEITRLHSRFDLPPDADIGRIILAEQERIFLRESGIEAARPEAAIKFSRSDGYPELLEIVRVHGYTLITTEGRLWSPEEIAANWYDSVYLPTVDAILKERLGELFPRATEADMFLSVYRRRRTLFAEPRPASMEDAVRAVGEEQRARPRVRAKRAVKKLRPPPRPQD